MKNQIFLAFALLCFSFTVHAQQTPLFSKTSLTRDYHRIASKYEAVSLNKQKLNEIKTNSPQQLTLEIPFENKILKLELNKVTITAPGFEVKVASAGGKINTANYTTGIFYQGKILGEVKSFVTFGFFNDQVYGIMSDSKSNITLGGLETNGVPSSSEFVIYRDSELKVTNPFQCETPESPLEPGSISGVSQQSPVHANRTNYVGEPIDIYYECDYAFFQNKGSVDNVVNYVLAFFNNVQQLYANENIHVQISQIKVWTTPDPYVSFANASGILGQFSPAMGTDPYIGDYAHFLTTRNIGGGVAYLLPNPCASSRANRTAVSGIQSSYQNFPTYSWTVTVTTHEQGHNFGSNHTQWCGWTGGALDNCYAPEGTCPTGPAPTNGGTIMSYCHLTPTGINYNNGFGTQPGDKIRTVIGNAACFGSCRMMVSVAKSDASCGQNNGSATVTTTNGTAPFTYTWNNGQTGATLNNLAPGTYYVKVKDAANCEVMGQADVGNSGSTLSVTVTPSGTASFCTGGNVLLTATSNTGYTYQWSRNGTAISGATNNTYTATLAGSYTVYVASGACNTTTTAVNVVEVSVPAATITAAGPTSFCSGSSVILNANTGTGLQYQWFRDGTTITGATSTSYTANTAGNYTVTVSAGSCQTTSSSTTVTVNTAPPAIITASGPVSFCAPGNVILNASTGSGYTYQWYNNGSPISSATNNSYTATVAGSYTVKVTSSGCETTSSATTVSVYTNPTATITANGATTFCAGGSITLDANTGSGLQYQWHLNGNAISNATSSSYIASTAGNYTVTVIAGNCQATSTATTVSINAAPAATVTASGSTSFCQGGNVVLNANTGSGYTYQWSRDAVIISGATNSSYTATIAGNYTVSVMSNGCQTSSTGTLISVNALPDATVTAGGSLNFCTGGSVTLTVATGSGLQYQWYKDGSVISGATNNTYTASTAGNYTVAVSAGSCQSTSAGSVVTVSPAPSSVVTASGALTFCSGGNVILTANSGSGYTYQWNKDGSIIPAATSISYTATTSGNYTVTVSAAGCQVTSSASIVNVASAPNASVTASGTLSFCQGNNVVLTVAGGSGLQFQWFNNGTIITGATNNSFTATATGNYTVTISSGSCQSTSSSNNVTVSASPTASITATGALTFCSGGSVLLNATTGTGYTYQWKKDGSPITGATNNSYSAISSGSYTVTVSNNGCQEESPASVVNVASSPDASVSASGALSFCQGGNVTLTVASGAGLQYQWYKDGTVVTGATSNTYSAITSGNYTVNISAGSCQSTSGSNIVTVSPAPAASVTANGALSFCSGGSVTLTASTGSGYTYQWLRDGSAINGAITNTYSAATSGNYTVTVSNNGCQLTSTATTVSVSPSPDATVNASGPLGFCTGGSVTLNVPTASGLQYQWFRDGSSITGATTNSYTATLAGNYTITVISSNCQATSTSNVVSVNPAPVASITNTGAVNFCQGSNVILTATTGSGYSYQWMRNGTAITGAVQSTYAANITGSYSVEVFIGGCSRTSTAISVNVLAAPVVTVTPTNSTIEKFQTQTLTAAGAVSYNWAVQPNVVSSTSSSVVVRPLTTTTYTIEGTGTNGCRSISSAIVQVIGCGPINNIRALPLSPTRAMITWTNPDGSTSDSLQYRVAGTTTWSSIFVSGSQHLLTHLEPNSDYEYRLVALCGTTDTFLPSASNLFKTPLMVGEVYIKLYPNPVYDIANLEIGSNTPFDLSIEIFNNQGQKVLVAANGEKHPAGSVIKNINVFKLTSGMYTIKASLNGKSYSVKMIIGR